LGNDRGSVGHGRGWTPQRSQVAITMSRKITPLNHGQGFTANLVTAVLVIFASRQGLPVSTTHVAVGSLFGIGSQPDKQTRAWCREY